MSKITYINTGWTPERKIRWMEDQIEKWNKHGTDLEFMNFEYDEEVSELDTEIAYIRFRTAEGLENQMPSKYRKEEYDEAFSELIEKKEREYEESVSGEIKYIQTPEAMRKYRDKTKVYDLLEDEVPMPDSIKLEEYDDFEDFLSKHGEVCIKPARGNQGQGITKVEEKGSRYYLTTNIDIENIEESSHEAFKEYDLSEEEFEEFFQKYSEISDGPSALIQEWINPRKIDGKIFDLRTYSVFNENHHGARIGEEGLTTNLSTGVKTEDRVLPAQTLIKKGVLTGEEKADIEHYSNKASDLMDVELLACDWYLADEPLMLEANTSPGTILTVVAEDYSPEHLLVDKIVEREYGEELGELIEESKNQRKRMIEENFL